MYKIKIQIIIFKYIVWIQSLILNIGKFQLFCIYLQSWPEDGISQDYDCNAVSRSHYHRHSLFDDGIQKYPEPISHKPDVQKAPGEVNVVITGGPKKIYILVLYLFHIVKIG